MVGQIYPLLPKIEEAAESLNIEQVKDLAASQAAASRLVSASFWEVAAAVVFGLVAGIAGLWVVRRVACSLRHSAGELMALSREVASAADQIAQSNQSLAQGISQQAASVQETSAATEDITSMTRQSAAGTHEIAQLMVAEAGFISEANRKLDHMISSMQEIVVFGGKIKRIVKTIDELAFQSNLLALSASVEAARSGESGLGFAVVADEVRSLARRSREAARATDELISASVAASTSGGAELDGVAEVVRSITRRTLTVKARIDQVNQTSQEQALGLDQIAKAIAQIEQVTTITAAHAQQRASASEQLSAQSGMLRDIVPGLHEMV